MTTAVELTLNFWFLLRKHYYSVTELSKQEIFAELRYLFL